MRWHRGAFFGALGLALSLAAGCSRQTNVLPSNPNAPGEQRLPFAGSSIKGAFSPTAALAASSLPPGTLLTGRIQSAVSSVDSHPGDSFAVTLDPIMMDDQTLIPSGAQAAGRVIDARASQGAQEPGYLRLVLTSISLGGKSIPLQTASVFAKGGLRSERPLLAGTADGGKKDVRFPAQSRMTFRLTEALAVPE